MSAPRRQFRDALRAFVPPWLADRGPLTKSTGFKLLWSFGAVLDGLTERLVQGAQAHLPGLGTTTALPFEGRGRGILRGQVETDEAYAERLRRWLDSWRVCGHPLELLRQIRAYIGEDVKVRTVDYSGNWHTIDAGGAESWIQVPGSFNWDNALFFWARLWVIIYAPPHWFRWAPFGTALPWGGGVQPGRNYTLGQTTAQDVAQDIHALCKVWKPKHIQIPHIIVAFDPESFDPLNSATWPDGNWATYCKGSPLVPSRTTTARYWAGVD